MIIYWGDGGDVKHIWTHSMCEKHSIVITITKHLHIYHSIVLQQIGFRLYFSLVD